MHRHTSRRQSDYAKKPRAVTSRLNVSPQANRAAHTPVTNAPAYPDAAGASKTARWPPPDLHTRIPARSALLPLGDNSWGTLTPSYTTPGPKSVQRNGFKASHRLNDAESCEMLGEPWKTNRPLANNTGPCRNHLQMWGKGAWSCYHCAARWAGQNIRDSRSPFNHHASVSKSPFAKCHFAIWNVAAEVPNHNDLKRQV